MDRIQTDAGKHFTPKEFQEGLYVHGLLLALATPDHKEINGQVEVACQTLRTISHSIMVTAWVSDEYIHFSLIYTTGRILPVLPIKHLVNQDGEPTTPNKLATDTKLQYQKYLLYSFQLLYKLHPQMLTQRR